MSQSSHYNQRKSTSLHFTSSRSVRYRLICILGTFGKVSELTFASITIFLTTAVPYLQAVRGREKHYLGRNFLLAQGSYRQKSACCV